MLLSLIVNHVGMVPSDILIVLINSGDLVLALPNTGLLMMDDREAAWFGYEIFIGLAPQIEEVLLAPMWKLLLVLVILMMLRLVLLVLLLVLIWIPEVVILVTLVQL